jgi:hypothetical protein
MSTESKVAGFEPGEFVRDPADERFTAALPRQEKQTEADYIGQLVSKGLVVVLEREDLRTGGYPKAKAQAVVKGIPLLVPLDDVERAVAAQQAANSPDASPLADPDKRAAYIEAERQKAKPFYR